MYDIIIYYLLTDIKLYWLKDTLKYEKNYNFNFIFYDDKYGECRIFS